MSYYLEDNIYDDENVNVNEGYIQYEEDVNTKIINNFDIDSVNVNYNKNVNNPKNPLNINILYNYYDATTNEERIENFKNLMNEHKMDNQLYLESGKYRINRKLKDNFLRKAEKYYGNDVSETLKLLIQMTTYVTFDEFYESLCNCVCSFLEKIENSPYILLYMGREDKSNFWVMELAFDIIINNYPEKMPYDILRNYDDVEYIYGKNPKNLKYVIFDDCSYSGIQLDGNMFMEFKNIKNIYNFYVIVPYISETAFDLISYSNGENYTENNLIYRYKILNISKILRQKGYDSEFIYDFLQNLLVYINDFNVGPDKKSGEYSDIEWNDKVDNIPIYFDHKIADSVSSYPKLYSFGITYDKYKHFYIYNWLIVNCINSLRECPPKVYKNRTKYIDFDYEKHFL